MAIRVTDDGLLVLTPRAFAEGDARNIQIPLERGYVCPNCNFLIYGAFRTRKDKHSLVNLNVYGAFNEHATQPPNYKMHFLEFGAAEKFQLFMDDFHCGEGKLVDRVNHAAYNRCHYVKFFYEPNYRRLFERVKTDLACCEIYGTRLNGQYVREHSGMLKKCQEHFGAKPENIRHFLEHHPYGRFLPDVAKKGPEAYVMKFRHEANVLHTYYQQVLDTNYECLHNSENAAA